MKRIASIILLVCMLAGIALSASAATSSETIKETIIALGVMTGDENGDLNLTKNVTRAEFAKMLVSASVYKDTMQEGSGSSPFKDVKHTHWAADYVSTVVSEKWMTGYVDGTFRPDRTITYEEAASAVLKLLGYGSADLTGTYPKAQISKFVSLKLAKGISPVQGQALTRNECMYIFYNLMGATTKDGMIYGETLDYTMNSDGEIDFDILVEADVIEGPYVINGNLSSVLPFDIKQAVVYRNNRASSGSAIVKYDVVYYNEYKKTVWAYSDRAIGVFTAVAPSAVSPTSVTVAGNSYALSTDTAQDKLSATGDFVIGDTVALLLGMEGDVVDVIPASEIDGAYYGVVTKTELSTYSVNTSRSDANYMLTVACTDGVTRECVVPGNVYSAGNVVSISYSKGECTVKRPGASNISGTVNNAGTRLDDYVFADNIEIMDVSKDGEWTIIFPSRLSGVKLPQGSVTYYVQDKDKKITHLILSDATGDMYSYGIIIRALETETPGSTGVLPDISGTYQYIIGGVEGAHKTSGKLLNVSSGPAIFYYKNGQIDRVKNLTQVNISELSELSVTAGNQKYGIADGVYVYIRSGDSSYSMSELSAISTDKYTLYGYYETIYPAGGQIRLIVAVKK